MIAKMDAIEAPSKKQKLDEAASMNISMNADDASQVGQLMAMMRNAGMDAKPVSDMPLSPRMDMEKNIKALGNIGMDDNPDIPGKDDVPGDMDLTGSCGSSHEDTDVGEGDYANSPDEEYKPYSDVITPPTNDLNRSKKSYAKVAGGDNPMALEDEIKEQLANLYKEYKGKDVVEGKGSPKSKMIDVEDGMSKAEFYKEHPTASENEYDEIKQEIKDRAEENN